MTKSPCFLGGLMVILLVAGSIGYTAVEEEGLVRVGLVVNLEEIRLAAGDEGILLDLGDPARQALPWPGDQVLITAVAETLYINEIPVGKGPLLVIPVKSFLTWNEKGYRGELLIINKNGRLNLINRLPLEEYLRGVVPKEIPAGWPMAALKAQAIAARTYSLANLDRHRDDGFQLCTTTHCQVYQGITGEHPNTDRAVLETNRVVITYNDKLISAVYHDSSGGYTKDASEVWSASVPYLKPAPGWDLASPYSQWDRSFSWEELQAHLLKAYPEIGELKQLMPAAFASDGRIIKLTLMGVNGEAVVSGEQFRHATGIPSSNMKLGITYGPEPTITLWWPGGQDHPEGITTKPEIVGVTAGTTGSAYDFQLQDKIPLRLEIRGAGRGHGVGLSQWGAKGMAEAGYNERQILEHFYPGVTLTEMVSDGENVGETVTNVSE